MAAQPAPLGSITVGDIKITYLPDGEGHFITSAFMPASSEEGWALHQQWLDDERRLVTTFGGFLIETGDRKVAVDLGFGDASVEFPGFGTLAGGRYLDSRPPVADRQLRVGPGDHPWRRPALPGADHRAGLGAWSSTSTPAWPARRVSG